MKKIVNIFLRILICVIICIALYFLLAFLLSRVSTKKQRVTNTNINAYILSNGVHTDIVVPLNNEVFNWKTFIKSEDILSKDTTFNLVGFGWGDKSFYLETPTWNDLTFKTAFKAAFGLGASAMHVTYFKNLAENKRCKKLELNKEQYLQLIGFIKQRFLLNKTMATIKINTNAVYGTTDAFYEAKGKYSLFETCNTWTNNSLKICGQKACVWTPFEGGILYHYNN